jgi:hypothetical protein
MTGDGGPPTGPTAVRVDGQTGVREEAAFLGEAGERIFAFAHLPASAPSGALLICPSLATEFRRNYRREVLLGRALAASGVAVGRLHYLGTGSGDPVERGPTFELLRESALTATGWLHERAGQAPMAFMGARWGGIVAASVAAGFDGVPLVLWEPAIDGRGFFREMFRARVVRDLRVEGRGSERRVAPAEELERQGFADLLGHRLDTSLYQSAVTRSLTEELGDRPRPVLLFEPTRRTGSGPFSSVAARWREQGFDVDVRTTGGDDVWSYFDPHEVPQEGRSSTGQLVQATAAWVEARLGGKVRS